MTRFTVSVKIVPRHGLLDPQGKAVTDALHTLGFASVRDVHVGRLLVIDLEAADTAAAQAKVREMCERLLANPVTEDFVLAEIAAT